MRQFWGHLKTQTWFKILANRYVFSLLLFGIWMGFLDVNSWLIHRELKTEISGLETSIDYYKREIEKDEEQLKQLNSGDKNLEKFAREQYYLAGPGESIFLIEIPKELE